MRRSLLLFALLFAVGVVCFADSIRVCLMVASENEALKVKATSIIRREMRKYDDLQIVDDYDFSTHLALLIHVIEPSDDIFVLYAIACGVHKPEYGGVHLRLKDTMWVSGYSTIHFEESCTKIIYWFDSEYVESVRKLLPHTK